MSDETSRVRLNLRVDEEVKREFNNEIESKFGKCRPYAGVELERELRYFLGDEELADLRDVVDDLEDTLGESESKEKIRESDRGETAVASHRIADDVRRSLVAAAEDDYRSAGELVEAIMYGYIIHGSVVERVTEKLQQIAKQYQSNGDDSLGAKARRTRTIAQELRQSNPNGFMLDDFDEAVEAARGIGVSEYTREQYLPRVLDKLDFTWHPKNPELFVATESLDRPDVRDPTNKPLILMDKEDMRLAIKLAAYRASKSGVRDKAVFRTNDVIDLLDGQVRKRTVRPLMRKIAEDSPGYQYDQDDELLKVDQKEVERHDEENLDILNVKSERVIPGGGDD